jgi:hypothetical protein
MPPRSALASAFGPDCGGSAQIQRRIDAEDAPAVAIAPDALRKAVCSKHNRTAPQTA